MTLLRRPGAAIATLLILVLGAAFLTQVVPYRQIIDANNRVNTARATLAQLEEENTALQADLDALGTPAEIERLAREKLGYVRPGETAYVVLDPPGAPDVEVTTETLPVPERTWVEEVWDFLSGADVES